MTRRRVSWLIMAAAVTATVVWFAVCAVTYVPADQATADRIKIGMRGSEVERLFGRPPFQDSDVTLQELPEIRGFLHGNTTTRDWDGPEGLITVVFDEHDRVQKVSCFPSDNSVRIGPWIRARLGWWP